MINAQQTTPSIYLNIIQIPQIHYTFFIIHFALIIIHYNRS